MKRVHVLFAGLKNPNSVAFVFPLYRFSKALRAVGWDIRIFTSRHAGLADCDVLLIENKIYEHFWDPQSTEQTLRELESWRSRTKLIWCDQSDSTGTLIPDVLPYVDLYCKAQILRDPSHYASPLYGGRAHTDYYHHYNGVADDEPYIQPAILDPALLSKMHVSWNSGLMDYSWRRPYIMKILSRATIPSLMQFPSRAVKVQVVRPIDVASRMGIGYKRATVRFQRERLRTLLSEHIRTDKISHTKYLRELARSKISVSPFGFGEITLKDFETFLAGAVLVKPDMTHMLTWPNFYERDVTYAAHDWDLENVQTVIETLLGDTERREALAQQAQERFLAYTSGPNAARHFCEHFAQKIQLAL